MQNSSLHYFRWAFLVTALGLIASFWYGVETTDSLGGGITFLLIGSLLAVLEISLSFDNAIVNANKLQTMSPIWRQRFLTWGILIAVFGMRIIFPLLVVAVAARIGPLEALNVAITDPDRYSVIMADSHLSIAAFGGAFLSMVALTYFIDEGKEVDWIRSLEAALRRCASIRGLQFTIALVLILIFGWMHHGPARATFVLSALFGLVVFSLVEVLGQVLDQRLVTPKGVASGGLGAFLYLEVLDASFSFDGVIGAFALTQNLFLIAIGLGIGAMYVRSMTIMLVERKTLAEFRYLEHGAFWSILALALIMFAQSFVHIPELVTGLIGAGLIGLSFLSSVRHNRKSA